MGPNFSNNCSFKCSFSQIHVYTFIINKDGGEFPMECQTGKIRSCSVIVWGSEKNVGRRMSAKIPGGSRTVSRGLLRRVIFFFSFTFSIQQNLLIRLASATLHQRIRSVSYYCFICAFLISCDFVVPPFCNGK